jgi:hypothetical protein
MGSTESVVLKWVGLERKHKRILKKEHKKCKLMNETCVHVRLFS